MCVAVPGKIIWVGQGTTVCMPARIDDGRAVHDIDLVLVPEARVGDHVIVHSGYAVRIVTAHEAAATFELLDGPLSG